MLRRPFAPLVVLALCACALGIFLRVHNFDFPERLLFDERHFVHNAFHYLEGKPDTNDHPPLGKLWMAVSVSAFGRGPVGFRGASLVAGLLSLAFGSWTAARLFGPLAGICALALLGLDGFFIAYSRAGLLDGFLLMLGFAVTWTATLRRPVLVACVGGLLVGLAANIKFSGITTLVAPLIALAFAPTPRLHRLGYTLLLGALTVGTYLAAYAGGLALSGLPASISSVVEHSRGLYLHHLALTEMKHPLTSGWVSWVVPTRPIVLGFIRDATSVRALSMLGNLVIWWPAAALGLFTAGTMTWLGLAQVTAGPLRFVQNQTTASSAAQDSAPTLSHFVRTHGRGCYLVLGQALAFLAPWVATHRDSYIYHYLPVYGLLVVLLAGFVAFVARAKPRRALLFLCLVTLCGGYYAPVWSFMPLSPAAYEQRLFVRSWR